MAGFLDLTGLSRFKSKLLEAIANVYVTKKANSEALNLKVNKSDLEAEIKRVLGTLETGIPVGTVAYAHDVPTGWLQCNGAAVSRTTYARLFKKIGTKYGAGDGSTTFNLPDLQHRVLEGTNTTSEVAQKVEAGLPDITGDLYPLYSASRNEVESGALKYGKQSSTAAGEGSLGETMWKTIAFNASSSSALFGRSDTNQMASLRLMAIIKA